MSRYCTIPALFGLRRWFEGKFGDLCYAHDLAYVTKHMPRKEADLALYRGMRERGYPLLGWFAYAFSRTIGWFYWIT